MKKTIFFFALTAMLATGCATGLYMPNNINVLGAQTTVNLEKANFQVVRSVEAVVEINNSNLKRVDVEKSAYAELLRNARLTGSQVLTNVVIEEVRRVNGGLFIFKRYKQYVAARGTVIEFLPEGVLPIKATSNSLDATSHSISTNVVNNVPSPQKTEPAEVTPTVPNRTESVINGPITQMSEDEISHVNLLINELYNKCITKKQMQKNGVDYYMAKINQVKEIYKEKNIDIFKSEDWNYILSRVESVFGIKVE